MLNTFPTLLSFAIFVPFIFRIIIFIFLFEIVIALKNKHDLINYFKSKKYLASKSIPWILQIGIFATSVLILIGLYTQISTLIAMYFLMITRRINKHVKLVKQPSSTFGYISLICFSLLLLGAGAFAFDIPL